MSICSANHRNESHLNRVILFDLNGFKGVNDTYGHEAGDELLKFIAVTVSAHLPTDTLLARLGGDEFVVLIRESVDGFKTRKAVDSIRQAASSTFIFRDQTICVSASVGVSSPATAQSTAKQLLHESDLRMYADKEKQRCQRDSVNGKVAPVILRAKHTVRSVNERRKVRARRSKVTAVTLGQGLDVTVRPS